MCQLQRAPRTFVNLKTQFQREPHPENVSQLDCRAEGWQNHMTSRKGDFQSNQ